MLRFVTTETGGPAPNDQQQDQVVAMVLRTFSFAPPSGHIGTATNARKSVQETATDWQRLGAHATWFELLGTNLGVGRDRLHELVGCAAATGEQLGLAWTAEQDTQRWVDARSDARRMARRAMADMTAHFSLGAAHGMANSTLRTLHLSLAAETFLSSKGFRRFPPFSDDRRAWPTFNERLVQALENAGAAIANNIVVDFVAVLRNLLNDARYKKMEERRGMDYHRWRPQGLPAGGGVPQQSFWNTSNPGVASLSFGGMFPADPRAEPDAVCVIAADGMEAVADSMRTWIPAWQSALNAMGIKIWNTS